MPDAVAIYGALVGTASLGWQVWRAVQSDRQDVRVTVAPMPVAIQERTYELKVTIRNHGRTVESVEAVGLNFLDPTDPDPGSARSAVRTTINEALTPRHNVQWTWNLGTTRFTVGREYQAFAKLASGVTEVSEWHEFSADSLAIAGLVEMVREVRSMRR